MKSLLKELAFPVTAVVAAFVVGGLVVLALGDSPLLVYFLFLSSAFGSADGIAYTLFYATPLIFTGLAVAVAFRCGLLNIGAEGQLVIGSFGAAWLALALKGWPSLVVVMAAAIFAMLIGGMWSAIPGVMKAKFGAHEVITTIMMNFIAFDLASYLTSRYKSEGDAILQTKPIAEVRDGVISGPHIPRFHTLLAPFGIHFPERLPLNLSFVLALGVCVIVYVFLWRTRWGYELRAVGESPLAAEYGGVSTSRTVIIAMAISGMLAGMVGINEVLGYRYRYYHGFSAQYGFTGIAVALLGRNHPLGVVFAAIVFGALARSALFINIFTDHVSKDWVTILQGTIILFVACEAAFKVGYRRMRASRGNEGLAQ